MNGFNPLSGAILGSTQVQQAVQNEKERHIRRSQALSKNVAAEDDRLEHQVESTDTVTSVRDEDEETRHQRKSHEQPGDDDDDKQPHIDVTA